MMIPRCLFQEILNRLYFNYSLLQKIPQEYYRRRGDDGSKYIKLRTKR